MAWRTITINNQGGSGTSPNPIYQNTVGPFYASAESTASQYRLFNGTSGQALSSIPTKANNKLRGFYTGTGGSGTMYIDATGFLFGVPILSTDITIYAHWTPYYRITLSKGEYGSGGTSTLYYRIDGGGIYADAELTTLATSVTSPTGGGNFKGYYYGGVLMIDADGDVLPAAQALALTSDATFTAAWFGGAIDYFGLASATLVPFESDDGVTRPHIVTRIYGKAAGADQTGPIWRNPTVRYMVVGDMTLAVTLGKAVAAKTGTIYGPYLSGSTWMFGNHTGMTQTGYMITSVVVETALGRPPVVTVSAVANEGADAINTFGVSVPITARHRAQNLLGAISGGGELHAYSLAAVCDPVVLQEGMDPCASDAVNGRYEVHGETLAIYGDGAPTAAGGFTALGEPEIRAGVGWTRFNFSARKEIT